MMGLRTATLARRGADINRDEVSPESIELWLTNLVARHIERSPMEIDRDVPLSEYGLDSVYVLALCADIEDHWSVSVEPTLMWDYPTIAGFGNALSELINESKPIS